MYVALDTMVISANGYLLRVASGMCLSMVMLSSVMLVLLSC
jgi:hypothetical protein